MKKLKMFVFLSGAVSMLLLIQACAFTTGTDEKAGESSSPKYALLL